MLSRSFNEKETEMSVRNRMVLVFHSLISQLAFFAMDLSSSETQGKSKAGLQEYIHRMTGTPSVIDYTTNERSNHRHDRYRSFSTA